MSQTLTQELVDLIRDKTIDDTDLHQATLMTLDAIANSVGGRRSTPGEILCRWSEAEQRDTPRQAFLLGGLTHILETDDLHRASVTHPGCVVVPAALAIGHRRQSGGHALLVSVLRGFEAMCRIGNGVGPTHYRIWHNTATCGPFGSAMATATLLDLSKEQCVHALGNAGTQSAGLWEFLETGAMSKHLHAGRAAESGVLAAELAQAGFTGPPAILEGKKGFFAGTCPDARPHAILADPDAQWQLRQTSVKPWPCCRHTQPAVDAALALHGRLQGRGINSVRADVYQATLDVCDRPHPRSEYEGKFSIYHCIAAALTDGRVDFDSFSPAGLDRLAGMREKVTVRVAEPFNSAYPDRWGSAVTVTTTAGEEVTEQRAVCKGDPEAPLSDEEMVTKARMLLRYSGMTKSRVEKLISSVLELTEDRIDWAVLRAVFPGERR